MKNGDYFKVRAKPDLRTGCLNWQLSTTSNGYGRFGDKGKAILAHRGAWAAVNGPIPDGMCICHKCDNRRCVNVDHLFIGTVSDNVLDMYRKGRASKAGERNGRAKLTQAGVASIRRKLRLGVPGKEIAAMYNVSPTAVARINTGATWQTK